MVWTKLLKHAVLLAKQAFAWLNLKGLILCLFCVSIMNMKISFCAKTEVREPVKIWKIITICHHANILSWCLFLSAFVNWHCSFIPLALGSALKFLPFKSPTDLIFHSTLGYDKLIFSSRLKFDS